MPERDFAVLRPARKPEVVVPAVRGGGVNIDDETYAIGHPLGLVDSFSSGRCGRCPARQRLALVYTRRDTVRVVTDLEAFLGPIDSADERRCFETQP